jgi:Ca2+-binding RTX toxin-like protein
MPINIMTGTDSDDRLNATNRRDQISLLAGDDWQVLVGGRDTVYGGDGSDTVFGYFGGDQIFGGDGDDELVSSTGAGEAPSLLDGGAGNDRIFAGDVLADAYGGDGDDTVTVYFGQGGMAEGGAGMDLLVLAAIGPLGDSLPAVADVTVILTGPGAGATAGAFALDFAGFEALGVTTSYGNDTVRGGDLDDVIDVDGGANDVQALGGNDVVTYRTGEANLLDGGEGVDTLVVWNLYQSGTLRFFADDGDDSYGSTFTGFERYTIFGWTGNDRAVLGAATTAFRAMPGAIP